jgi:hypothetical protein
MHKIYIKKKENLHIIIAILESATVFKTIVEFSILGSHPGRELDLVTVNAAQIHSASLVIVLNLTEK